MTHLAEWSAGKGHSQALSKMAKAVLKLGDTIWRVRGADLPEGAKVRVTGVDDGTLIVESTQRLNCDYCWVFLLRGPALGNAHPQQIMKVNDADWDFIIRYKKCRDIARVQHFKRFCS